MFPAFQYNRLFQENRQYTLSALLPFLPNHRNLSDNIKTSRKACIQKLLLLQSFNNHNNLTSKFQKFNRSVFFQIFPNRLTKAARCITKPQLEVVVFSLSLLLIFEHNQSCHEILKIQFSFQVSQLRQIRFGHSKNRNLGSNHGRIQSFWFREVSKK